MESNSTNSTNKMTPKQICKMNNITSRLNKLTHTDTYEQKMAMIFDWVKYKHLTCKNMITLIEEIKKDANSQTKS